MKFNFYKVGVIMWLIDESKRHNCSSIKYTNSDNISLQVVKMTPLYWHAIH